MTKQLFEGGVLVFPRGIQYVCVVFFNIVIFKNVLRARQALSLSPKNILFETAVCLSPRNILVENSVCLSPKMYWSRLSVRFLQTVVLWTKSCHVGFPIGCSRKFPTFLQLTFLVIFYCIMFHFQYIIRVIVCNHLHFDLHRSIHKTGNILSWARSKLSRVRSSVIPIHCSWYLHSRAGLLDHASIFNDIRFQWRTFSHYWLELVFWLTVLWHSKTKLCSSSLSLSTKSKNAQFDQTHMCLLPACVWSKLRE